MIFWWFWYILNDCNLLTPEPISNLGLSCLSHAETLENYIDNRSFCVLPTHPVPNVKRFRLKILSNIDYTTSIIIMFAIFREKKISTKNFPKKEKRNYTNWFSPRFQKSHLENRVMSSKMWKSDFLRFWYTFTWPQASMPGSHKIVAE